MSRPRVARASRAGGLSALLLLTACTRPHDPPFNDAAVAPASSSFDGSLDARSAELPDAARDSEPATDRDAAADASPDAADAAVAHPHGAACARCGSDEYCMVIHKSSGTLPHRYSIAVVCEKFPPECGKKRNCACLGAVPGPNCSEIGGRVREDSPLSLP